MNPRWSIFLLVTLLLAPDMEARARKRSTRARAAEPKVLDAAAINDPNAAKTSPEAAILRAQILLDRANVSPGEIDGRPGANFDRALAGFQESRSLPATGKLDDPTWAGLNGDSSPAIVPYRITDADVAGPFVEVPKDLAEQSKLKALGYQKPEEAPRGAFSCQPGTSAAHQPDCEVCGGRGDPSSERLDQRASG